MASSISSKFNSPRSNSECDTPLHKLLIKEFFIDGVSVKGNGKDIEPEILFHLAKDPHHDFANLLLSEKPNNDLPRIRALGRKITPPKETLYTESSAIKLALAEYENCQNDEERCAVQDKISKQEENLPEHQQTPQYEELVAIANGDAPLNSRTERFYPNAIKLCSEIIVMQLTQNEEYLVPFIQRMSQDKESSIVTDASDVLGKRLLPNETQEQSMRRSDISWRCAYHTILHELCPGSYGFPQEHDDFTGYITRRNCFQDFTLRSLGYEPTNAQQGIGKVSESVLKQIKDNILTTTSSRHASPSEDMSSSVDTLSSRSSTPSNFDNDPLLNQVGLDAQTEHDGEQLPPLPPRYIAPEVPPRNIAPEVPPRNIAPEVPPRNIAPEVPPRNIAPEVPPRGIAPEVPPPRIRPRAPISSDKEPQTVDMKYTFHPKLASLPGANFPDAEYCKIVTVKRYFLTKIPENSHHFTKLPVDAVVNFTDPQLTFSEQYGIFHDITKTAGEDTLKEESKKICATEHWEDTNVFAKCHPGQAVITGAGKLQELNGTTKILVHTTTGSEQSKGIAVKSSAYRQLQSSYKSSIEKIYEHNTGKSEAEKVHSIYIPVAVNKRKGYSDSDVSAARLVNVVFSEYPKLKQENMMVIIACPSDADARHATKSLEQHIVKELAASVAASKGT